MHFLVSAATRVSAFLPRGTRLPEEAWQRRHRAIVILVCLHALGIACYMIAAGEGLEHTLVDSGVVAIAAPLAMLTRHRSRALSAVISSFGLVAASGVLVHLSGGYIEYHFHFFV